jgi:hypothetical protein
VKETHALRISLSSSRSASALVCVSCVATAALVAWLPGSAAARAGLVVAIGAYAIRTMRSWATRSSRHAIVGIELDLERSVCLIERDGLRIDGALQPDTYVGARLASIVIKPNGRHWSRSTAILPDMLPAEDFRRLRLLLRLGRVPITGAKS